MKISLKTLASIMSCTLLTAQLIGCHSIDSNKRLDSSSNTQSAAAISAEDARFNKVSNTVWQEYLLSQPIAASYAGLKESASQMPDMSEAAVIQQKQRLQGWLGLLSDIKTSKLNEQNQINLQILQHRLKNNLDKIKYNAHYMPLTSEGGFHSSLAFLANSTQLKSQQDIDNYLARLSAFPKYFEQQIAWMKKGIASGFTQPKVVLKGYEASISALISATPEKSTFYKPFKSIGFLSESEQLAAQEKAKNVIKEHVNGSYQMYFDFMVEEYIPNAKSDIGISSVPNGVAYYENRAKHYTTTDLSADDIHELGKQEVARIRAEMQTIIDNTDFDGSFAEFLAFLRSDPQFYATSAEELLKEASFIAKKMDAQLPKLFKKLPRTPYGVAPVPDHIAPKYTTGRYISASNDTDAGYYWVNTYGLDLRPLYELEALTLHEAVPGHHLQISLTKELENTPAYRSSYYISAFGEGWGLYAEWLGLEVGFYQDPYSNFGRLTYEMWRALRLVVDTGMHVKGWTRQQAVDFMKENSALSEHNINTEVDRYISWPGQALSYKIGEITIKKLRKQAEQGLGNQFDVREFHHQVLKNGSVILSQLEKQIERYINETLVKQNNLNKH